MSNNIPSMMPLHAAQMDLSLNWVLNCWVFPIQSQVIFFHSKTLKQTSEKKLIFFFSFSTIVLLLSNACRIIEHVAI